MKLPSTPSQTTAFWQIVGGFMLLWAPGVMAMVISRQLGLEGWVTAGWCSLGLAVLSIGLLWAFSPDARQACRAVPGGLRTKTSLDWILVLILGHVLLAGLFFALYKMQLAPAALGTDVGWAHYLGLPPDRRPDFLLHSLLLSSVNSVITGPVAEELFHIGVVVGVLRRCNFRWSWVLSFDALLFIILHYSYGVGRLDVATVAGYGFGRVFLDYLYVRTGNIAIPVIGHMLHNLVVLSFNWFPLLP